MIPAIGHLIPLREAEPERGGLVVFHDGVRMPGSAVVQIQLVVACSWAV